MVIAFLPIARTTFDIPFAQQKATQARDALLAHGLDIVGSDDLITDASGVTNAINRLQGRDLDLVVVFQATFADSSMVVKLAEALDAPLFLWAVPEPHSGGRLRLNSFCGINLAGHALARRNIHYGFAFADSDDKSVLEKISRYARVGRTLRILAKAKIGRVGENPEGFDTCTFNSPALKSVFGLEVEQLDLQKDVFAKVRSLSRESTQPVKSALAQEVVNLDQMDPQAVHGSLGTYLTLQEIAKDRNLQGFAVRCWPEFFTDLGCAACGAMAMLSDEMIPCSCEADVNGTITQLILQSISGSQAFGTDMVSVDQEKDALVLWHCGLAPPSMADPQVEKRVTIHSNRKLPLLMEFPLKPGPVTIARLSETNGNYRLVIGEGEIIRAPQSFSGTSGLIRFSRPASEVIDILLAEGLEHHISLTYGKHKDDLVVLAKMLKLPILCIS